MPAYIDDPEKAAELEKLYAELPDAYKRAASALRTDPPAHILEGSALQRFLEEDAKVSAIIHRIKEIQGV